MRPIAVALIAAVVASGTSGCSARFVRGPELEGTNCTTNVAPAVIDTVMSLAAGIAATWIFAEVASDRCEGDCGPAAGYAVIFYGVPSAILAATFGGYAVAGYWKTGKCRAFKRDEPARRERERAEKEMAMAVAAQRAEQERIEREPIERERAEQERIHRNNRDQAFGLKRSADQAARSGDCTTAINLGDQIRALDVDVWHGWFLRDLAIKRCLDAASAPAPVAPPVSPDAQPALPIMP